MSWQARKPGQLHWEPSVQQAVPLPVPPWQVLSSEPAPLLQVLLPERQPARPPQRQGQQRLLQVLSPQRHQALQQGRLRQVWSVRSVPEP